MSASEKRTVPPESTAPNDLIDLDLSFTPAWAREAPRVHQKTHDRFRNDGDADRSPHGRGPRRSGPMRHDPDRPSTRPDRPRAAGRSRENRDAEHPPSGAPGRGPDFRDRRFGNRQESFPPASPSFRPAMVAAEPPPPVEIRFLPDQKALAVIVRRIQISRRAFPLRDMARLFVDQAGSCQVRFGVLKDQSQLKHLVVCKRCGTPAVSAQEIEQHLVDEHLGDFFEICQVEVEPPKGVFTCVARCGVTGEWLGPPNHHATQERIQEILRAQGGAIREDAYRARITVSHDENDIEAWKQCVRLKTQYRLKAVADGERKARTPVKREPDDSTAENEGAEGQTESPAMDRTAAESLFRRELAPAQIATAMHTVCPFAMARKLPNAGLLHAVRDEWEREKRFPTGILFAIRGALRGKHMHLFRAENADGGEFVLAHAPSELDASHAVPELRMILDYIAAHSACKTSDVLSALAADPALACTPEHLSAQMTWLAEKGHLIVFYNGVVALPSAHPLFHRDPAGG